MALKNTLVFLIALLIFACNSQKATKDKITVMAYYVPEKDTPPNELPLDQLTHIIFSFTNVIDGEMKFQNPEESSKVLKQLVEQKQKYPDLKVMVACGGWGAGGFSDMAITEAGRKKFAQSVARFVAEYQLDGVDIDWEYPGMGSAGIDFRKEDKQTFTLLMKCLREHLNQIGEKQILTFASAGWKRYYEHIELLEVMKYVDYMNVMTYDQIGHTTPYTGHHTALGYIQMKDMEGTPALEFLESKKEEMAKRGVKFEPRSVEKIIDFCLKQGVKPEKIVIGAAFYGRSWKGVTPEQNGLYQYNKGSHIGWCSYHDIREKYESKNGFERYWDSIAKAPYLFNRVDSIFFTYDDTASVKLKTDYVIKNKLGGIMFWELSNDTKGENSLLDAINNAANIK